jgi:hypothetical protein
MNFLFILCSLSFLDVSIYILFTVCFLLQISFKKRFSHSVLLVVIVGCILTFHCPNKVEVFSLQRNYRFFFMFVSSTTILCLYVFAFCWVNVRKIMDVYHCNLWRAFLKSPVSGILVLYTFIAAWFVGGLTAFHLYLIITNQVPISCLPLLLFVVPIVVYFSYQVLYCISADNI